LFKFAGVLGDEAKESKSIERRLAVSLRTITDRIVERQGELERLEQLALDELERAKVGWFREEVVQEMPASLILDVLASPQSSL
jgi:uncharacterized membrane protein YccC